jgi:mannose-6-phosphate isomerase-like protein (cupin superfamily)
MQVRVTDRSGAPAEGAQVVAEGPSSRDGVTDATGTLLLRTLAPGTYRVRASGEEFITLEKEIAVRAGARGTTEFALSAAPPKPAPTPPPAPAAAPPPPAPAPTGTPGEPRIISVPDLAERSLGGRDPVRRVSVGCSGVSSTQLLVVRETTQAPPRNDIDEMLYVVAGEATLNLGGKEQAIASGWFSLVPRGTPHSLTRRGRNPAILLSITSGQPCGDTTR